MGLEVQTPEDVRNFIQAEREKCLSVRELAFRMRGFGYRVEKTESGLEVKSLMGGEIITTL